MNSKSVHSIGLMSGTSLDGLDIVYVKFHCSDHYDFEILAQETIKYSEEWTSRLQNAFHLDYSKIDELDTNYGIYLGEKVNAFIEKNRIKDVDFIASHGHTIFHEPHKGITKQIGSGRELMRVTQKIVVCDFRTQDVKLGGQGAPLVPIGDRLLFSEYNACINLGGFANISFDRHSQRIAFDICAVNTVLNYYSKKLGHSFDNAGEISRSGKIDQNVLEKLNSLNYYSKPYPKSLGIEWVHNEVFPILNELSSVEDILRTYVEHCAYQIAISLKDQSSCLFTGGGVYNTFLMERIKSLSNAEIKIPDEAIIDFKEALIFAFLGLRRIENKNNCLASVTGAKYDHSSGEIFNFN